MKIINLEVESSWEVEQLLEEVELIYQEKKSNYKSLGYSYTLFLDNEGDCSWRFDWDFVWKTTNDNLIDLLYSAIEMGKSL